VTVNGKIDRRQLLALCEQGITAAPIPVQSGHATAPAAPRQVTSS
jgi:hypothetical protein